MYCIRITHSEIQCHPTPFFYTDYIQTEWTGLPSLKFDRKFQSSYVFLMYYLHVAWVPQTIYCKWKISQTGGYGKGSIGTAEKKWDTQLKPNKKIYLKSWHRTCINEERSRKYCIICLGLKLLMKKKNWNKYPNFLHTVLAVPFTTISVTYTSHHGGKKAGLTRPHQRFYQGCRPTIVSGS